MSVEAVDLPPDFEDWALANVPLSILERATEMGQPGLDMVFAVYEKSEGGKKEPKFPKVLLEEPKPPPVVKPQPLITAKTRGPGGRAVKKLMAGKKLGKKDLKNLRKARSEGRLKPEVLAALVVALGEPVKELKPKVAKAKKKAKKEEGEAKSAAKKVLAEREDVAKAKKKAKASKKRVAKAKKKAKKAKRKAKKAAKKAKKAKRKAKKAAKKAKKAKKAAKKKKTAKAKKKAKKTKKAAKKAKKKAKKVKGQAQLEQLRADISDTELKSEIKQFKELEKALDTQIAQLKDAEKQFRKELGEATEAREDWEDRAIELYEAEEAARLERLVKEREQAGAERRARERFHSGKKKRQKLSDKADDTEEKATIAEEVAKGLTRIAQSKKIKGKAKKEAQKKARKAVEEAAKLTQQAKKARAEHKTFAAQEDRIIIQSRREAADARGQAAAFLEQERENRREREKLQDEWMVKRARAGADPTIIKPSSEDVVSAGMILGRHSAHLMITAHKPWAVRPGLKRDPKRQDERRRNLRASGPPPIQPRLRREKPKPTEMELEEAGGPLEKLRRKKRR